MAVITEDGYISSVRVDDNRITIRPIIRPSDRVLMIRLLNGRDDYCCWLTEHAVHYIISSSRDVHTVRLTDITTEDENDPLLSEYVLDMHYMAEWCPYNRTYRRGMILLHCDGEACYKICCDQHNTGEYVTCIEAISPTLDGYAMMCYAGVIMEMHHDDKYDDLESRYGCPWYSEPTHDMYINPIIPSWTRQHRSRSIKLFTSPDVSYSLISNRSELYIVHHNLPATEKVIARTNYDSRYGEIVRVFFLPEPLVLTDIMHVVTNPISEEESAEYGPYINVTRVRTHRFHNSSLLCIKSEYRGDLFSQDPISGEVVVIEVSIPQKIVSTELDISLCYPGLTKPVIG